uniref:Uncharacterized protein n=1 Tax=Rhizophora mucronata TaxID=61149 RepID=A0A2P2KRN1_RHIMU
MRTDNKSLKIFIRFLVSYSIFSATKQRKSLLLLLFGQWTWEIVLTAMQTILGVLRAGKGLK